MTPINQHMVQTSHTKNPSNKTSNAKEVMQERFKPVRNVIEVDPTGEYYPTYIRNHG
jgi:hypothetical protein